MPAAEERSPEEVALAAALAALASPNRLALLHQLRVPKGVGDIRLTAEAPTADGAPADRIIARKAVRDHVLKLVEEGFVGAIKSEKDGGTAVQYVVNHQRVFAVSEELRELVNLRPVAEPAHPTLDDARKTAAAAAFPRLLVVRGLGEGAAHPLVPPPGAEEHAWTIGRKRGLALSLDYDPFVSLENARVTWSGGAYTVEDLPQSRNGTSLNFAPIPPATRVRLRHGDVLGVGRSLLVFQTGASWPHRR